MSDTSADAIIDAIIDCERISELEAENQRLRDAIDSAIPYLDARHTRIPLRLLLEALQEGEHETNT
jgi:hypothetical protein